MNIYMLDPRPGAAARYHTDRHCASQIRACAHVLLLAKHYNSQPVPHGATGQLQDAMNGENKHLAQWAQDEAAYYWVWEMMGALIIEFGNRTRSFTHSMEGLWRQLEFGEPYVATDVPPMPVCLPRRYTQHGDTVDQYRAWYRNSHYAPTAWTGVDVPEWY